MNGIFTFERRCCRNVQRIELAFKGSGHDPIVQPDCCDMAPELAVFVQVTASVETGQSGLTPQDAAPFLPGLSRNVSPACALADNIGIASQRLRSMRQCFVRQRQLRDQLFQSAPADL